MLSNLPPQANGLALGIGGLGILWRDVVTIYEFEKTWNSPNTVPGVLSHSFAYLCHTATALILMSYVAKAFVHRELFVVEMRSFPKVASLATGPMALATVCTSLVRVSVTAAQVLWLLALVLHLTCGAFYLVGIYQRTAFTKVENIDTSNTENENDDAPVRRTSDWTPHSPCQHATIPSPKFVKVVETSSPWNPAAFPPTVGIAALGSCSTGIGFPTIALATLLVGVCWAIIILVLIVFQILKSKSVDKEARVVILCAPYALCGAAFWAVRRQFEIEEGDAEDVMSNTLYVFLNVMALLLYLVVLSMAPMLWRLGQVAAPGSAAFTFPTVIVATCLVRSSDNPGLDPPLGQQVTQAIAWVACIIATIVVFNTIRQFVLLFRRMRSASESTSANSKVKDSGQISKEVKQDTASDSAVSDSTVSGGKESDSTGRDSDQKQVADKSELFELQDDELHDDSKPYQGGVKCTPVIV